MTQFLPPPFRPKLVNGYAIGGICLIRLKKVRPRFLPLPCGIRSENAAHRIAVEWEDGGRTREGVYIPRRDSDSRLNTLAGGTIFPGIHHHATFSVQESEQRFSLAFRSDDGQAQACVSGVVADRIQKSSVFPSIAVASAFFENGSLGYSTTRTSGRYDGLELVCRNWNVEPLAVDRVESSFFENEALFPAGSTEFDCALLMRDIHHEWHGREDLCCPAQPGSSEPLQPTGSARG